MHALDQTFQDEVEIYYYKSYRCEGECADIEVIDDVKLEDRDGWLFCDARESFYYPGFFSKEELNKEI
ncbi:hypothetical protein R4Z09_12405 [Niallia oryzisoli]|uniref:Uncharacterized protein n=1 Tax=Niallia oryzisoli TaxID=1737571 RepID=A0ABZ2CL42_9BACI